MRREKKNIGSSKEGRVEERRKAREKEREAEMEVKNKGIEKM